MHAEAFSLVGGDWSCGSRGRIGIMGLSVEFPSARMELGYNRRSGAAGW